MNEDSIGTKPDLQELGTRYDHVMELKEVFLMGIAVVDQMITKSEGDRRTKAKLEIAVEMINKRLDYLSDFADKTHFGSPLAREVRAAGIHRPMLMEGKDVKQKPQAIDQQGHSENSST